MSVHREFYRYHHGYYDSGFYSDILKSNKSCWLYWEYITSNNQDTTDDEPEFRSMNDAYLALYDSAKRTEYVDRVVDMLKKFMDNLK